MTARNQGQRVDLTLFLGQRGRLRRGAAKENNDLENPKAAVGTASEQIVGSLASPPSDNLRRFASPIMGQCGRAPFVRLSQTGESL